MVSRLEEAVKTDDIDLFKIMVSNNSELLEIVSVTAWQQDSMLLACRHGSFRIVEEITKWNPELLSNKYEEGYTALHIAASIGDVSMVMLLVNQNRQLRFETDDHFMIPLHIAVINGHEEVVRILADRESLPVRTAQGETALLLALKHCKEGVFKLLVTKVQEYNQVSILGGLDNEGNSLIHLATANRLIKALNLLLPAESSINRRAVGVNGVNKSGHTPLDLYYQLDLRDPATLEVGQILFQAARVEAQSIVLFPHSILEIDHQHTERATDQTLEDLEDPTKWSLKTRNVMLGVFVLFAAGLFASIHHLPTQIFMEEYVVGNIYSVSDVISGRLPTLFYFLVFHAVGFVMSVVMILTVAWSLPLWTAALVLFLFFFLIYFLIVMKTAPKVSITVGSRNIAASWMVWFFAGGVISVFVAVIALPKWLLRVISWLMGKFKIRNGLIMDT